MVEHLEENLGQADAHAAMVTATRTDQIVADLPSPHDETASGLHHASPKTPYIVAFDPDLNSASPLPKLDSITNAECPKLESSGMGCSRKACNPTLSKKELASPRILVLMLGFAYLAISCIIMNISGQAMRGYLQPYIHSINTQIEVAESLTNQKNMLYTQLEGVLSHPLSKSFMESYEECLARGLTSANNQFLGIDFTQYPEVRDETMNWATENCDRLFHAPRVLNDSPEEVKLTYWIKATYTTRQYARRAFTHFKRKASLIRMCLAGNKQIHVVTEGKAENSKSDHLTRHLYMPFGFEAFCHLSSPCKLVYRNSSVPTSTMVNLEELTTEAATEAATCSKLDELVGIYMRYNTFLIACFSLLEIMAGLAYMMTTRCLSNHGSPWSVASTTPSRPLKYLTHLRDGERYACGSLVIQFAVILAQLKLHSFISSGSHFLLLFSVAICGLSVMLNLGFLFPDDQIEEFKSMISASNELYLIMQGRESEIPICLVSSSGKTASANDHSPPRGSSASDQLEVRSKVAARFVSPMTTIHEDIQAELKTMRAQQSEPWRSRFEVDSDSDEDTDDEIFVELGCSAIPTVVERQDDWTLVDT
jgi:hypothetical protein